MPQRPSVHDLPTRPSFSAQPILQTPKKDSEEPAKRWTVSDLEEILRKVRDPATGVEVKEQTFMRMKFADAFKG